MLNAKENKISKVMEIPIIKSKEIDEVLQFEEKYNKNSLEIINLKENLTADFIKWQLLIEKLIYFNNGFYKINKINDVKYLTYNKRMKKDDFPNYLNLVKKYQTKNPNTIFLITNYHSYYKRILSGANQRNIFSIFLTNNKEDLYLEHSNIIVQYTEDIKKTLKALKPYEIPIELDEVM